MPADTDSMRGGSSSKARETSALVGEINKEIKYKTIDAFNGERNRLQGFLLQLRLYVKFNENRFRSETERVLWAVTLLEGKAMMWIEGFLEDYLIHTNPKGEMDTRKMEDTTLKIFGSWDGFIEEIKKNFGVADERREAERAIESLRQKGSATAYTRDFQRYSTRTEWGDEALCFQYRKGLKDFVKDELVRYPGETSTLEKLIDAACEIDNRWYERSMEKKGKFDPNYKRTTEGKYRQPRYIKEGDPMEIDATMDPQIRRKHMENKTCFNCGKPGHLARNCKGERKAYRQHNKTKRINALVHEEHHGALRLAATHQEVRLLTKGEQKETEDFIGQALGRGWIHPSGSRLTGKYEALLRTYSNKEGTTMHLAATSQERVSEITEDEEEEFMSLAKEIDTLDQELERDGYSDDDLPGKPNSDSEEESSSDPNDGSEDGPATKWAKDLRKDLEPPRFSDKSFGGFANEVKPKPQTEGFSGFAREVKNKGKQPEPQSSEEDEDSTSSDESEVSEISPEDYVTAQILAGLTTAKKEHKLVREKYREIQEELRKTTYPRGARGLIDQMTDQELHLLIYRNMVRAIKRAVAQQLKECDESGGWKVRSQQYQDRLAENIEYESHLFESIQNSSKAIQEIADKKAALKREKDATRTDHPQHAQLVWSFCPTDNCLIHISAKQEAGYWPKRTKPVYWKEPKESGGDSLPWEQGQVSKN
jgi:hypothetical protein